MIFGNPIVGGAGALVRTSIHSPDYIPGVQGWSINKDGTAEFNSTTIRGDLLVVGDNGSKVWIHEVGVSARIDVVPPTPDPLVDPGFIYGENLTPSIPQMGIYGPSYDGGTRASINLRYNNVADLASLDARAVQMSMGTALNPQSYFEILSNNMIVPSLRAMFGRDVRSTNNDAYNTAAAWVGMRDGKFYEEDNTGTAVTSQFLENNANLNITSGTFVADPGNPTQGIVIRHPASGRIIVEWAALLTHTVAGAFSLVSFEVRTGAIVGSGTLVFASADDRTVEHAGQQSASGSSFCDVTLPGSSGSIYNVRLMYRTQTPTMTVARRKLRVSPVLY